MYEGYGLAIEDNDVFVSGDGYAIECVGLG